MIPSKCCPKCKRIAVGTVAFDKWELFCPDCKIGAGIFNDWPMASAEDVARQKERDEYYAVRLNGGAYDQHPRLSENLRKRLVEEHGRVVYYTTSVEGPDLRVVAVDDHCGIDVEWYALDKWEKAPCGEAYIAMAALIRIWLHQEDEARVVLGKLKRKTLEEFRVDDHG